jgi:DNA-binding NarL/FixJ family response regulator
MLPDRRGAMNIILVDDHALFRDGLTMLLNALAPDIHVLAAASCEEAFQILDRQPAIDLCCSISGFLRCLAPTDFGYFA